MVAKVVPEEVLLTQGEDRLIGVGGKPQLLAHLGRYGGRGIRAEGDDPVHTLVTRHLEHLVKVRRALEVEAVCNVLPRVVGQVVAQHGPDAKPLGRLDGGHLVLRPTKAEQGLTRHRSPSPQR